MLLLYSQDSFRSTDSLYLEGNVYISDEGSLDHLSENGHEKDLYPHNTNFDQQSITSSVIDSVLPGHLRSINMPDGSLVTSEG